MGIIVKVYIENNDEEIEIVTLNPEDKKSSSVTITASATKDYLNKLGRNEDQSVRRSDRIASKKANRGGDETNVIVNYNHEDERPADSLVCPSVENEKCNLNVIQSENVTCSNSSINETFAPASGFFGGVSENTNDRVISENSSIMQLNAVRVVDTNESGNFVVERNYLLTANCDSAGQVVSNEVPPSGYALEDHDTSMCVDSDLSANPGLENADSSTLGIVNVHSQIAVNRRDGTGVNTLNIVESSSSYERRGEPETGAENVIASLQNVSYEVDDFLNMVNTTPAQYSPSKNDLRLCGFPSFLDEFSCSPSMYPEETEDDDELEEYFVVEKIAASRFNEETKVLEFLLKAKKCLARKDPWAPIRSNITDLTIFDPKSLYIQCPKSFKSHRRRLHEKFDQYVQFVDMERGFMFDIPSETISNCPSAIDNTTSEFLPDCTADVVVDPQKSLNDACLIEPCLDDNRNITPFKLPKNNENINNITDIGLPSAHFYIGDMVPGLGDQLAEFVENNPPISETKVFEEPLNLSSSDRRRKKHRSDSKHLQCPRCSYKTVSANALESHVRRHTKEFLKCELCPKRCLSFGGLKNHVKTHRNGEISSAETARLGVGDSLGNQNRFLANSNQHEVKGQPPFGENPSAGAKHFQPSRIANEAVTANRPSFGDCKVKCKSKSLKSQSKHPRGRPRKVKVETKRVANNFEIIDLCDDPVESIVPQDILTNAAPSESEILQECHPNTTDVVKSNDLFDSVAESSSNLSKSVYQECQETCDVSQQPFEGAADMLDHKEKVVKYPIVLLRRLSTSS